MDRSYSRHCYSTTDALCPRQQRRESTGPSMPNTGVSRFAKSVAYGTETTSIVYYTPPPLARGPSLDRSGVHEARGLRGRVMGGVTADGRALLSYFMGRQNSWHSGHSSPVPSERRTPGEPHWGARRLCFGRDGPVGSLPSAAGAADLWLRTPIRAKGELRPLRSSRRKKKKKGLFRAREGAN